MHLFVSVQLLDERLDVVRVLRVKLQSVLILFECVGLVIQLLVDFTQVHKDGCLLGCQLFELNKNLFALLVALKRLQNRSPLILGHRTVRVQLLGLLKAAQRLLNHVTVRLGDAKVGPEHGRALVNVSGVVKILVRFGELLLFYSDIA